MVEVALIHGTHAKCRFRGLQLPGEVLVSESFGTLERTRCSRSLFSLQHQSHERREDGELTYIPLN
jgi:hypothetical protein